MMSESLADHRILQTSNNQSKEHGQLRGVEDILEAAFSPRSDRHYDFTCAFSSVTVLPTTMTLEPMNIIVLLPRNLIQTHSLIS